MTKELTTIEIPLHRLFNAEVDGSLVLEQEPDENYTLDNRVVIPMDQTIKVQVNRTPAMELDQACRECCGY